MSKSLPYCATKLIDSLLLQLYSKGEERSYHALLVKDREVEVLTVATGHTPHPAGRPSPLLLPRPHHLVAAGTFLPSYLEPQSLNGVDLAEHDLEPVAPQEAEVHPQELSSQRNTCGGGVDTR